MSGEGKQPQKQRICIQCEDRCSFDFERDAWMYAYQVQKTAKKEKSDFIFFVFLRNAERQTLFYVEFGHCNFWADVYNSDIAESTTVFV